jgi:phosphatidylinositol 4-phosphatase
VQGDYTRTGERNLSGLVKDGVNSASRYYLNHIRDTYRQAAIDVLTAGGLSDSMLSQIASGEEQPQAATAAGISAEKLRAVMEECTRLLMPDVSGRVLGCWGLIDADEITGIADLIAIRYR